jgi:hypothetical protein
MTLRTFLLSGVVASLIAADCFAVVIGHQSINDLGSVSQGVMDFVGMQRWLFTHASVGGNMITGLNDLHSLNPTRFKLHTSSVGYNSAQQSANSPSTVQYGTVNECNRGNPGWDSKYTIFDNSVRNAGWHETTVDFAMDKLCYIDEDAGNSSNNPTGYTTYINKMSSLESAYPGTKFVYMTMPLTTSTGSDNVLRNQYNQVVRDYCINNDRLLFDIADMEAYDLAGNRQTFSYGGKTYEKLYSGYTDDGGHLNTSGQQQITKGWYATCVYGSRFVSFDENWVGTTAGHAGEWSTAGNWLLDTTASGTSITPDAPGIKLNFGKAGSNATADIGTVGRVIGGLAFQNAISTTISGGAVLTLDNNGTVSYVNLSGNHAINSGLYFKDNLEIGGDGSLEIGGSFTGDAGKILSIDNGTSVKLIGNAQDIPNSICVNGQLESGKFVVPTLTIGAGGIVTITPILMGSLASNQDLISVPEPNTLVMFALASLISGFILSRKK